MKALLFLAVLSAASPAFAQTKYTKATTAPPPGHTCADLYRSRDDASRYGALYENSNAAPTQPISCSEATPPPRPRQ